MSVVGDGDGKAIPAGHLRMRRPDADQGEQGEQRVDVAELQGCGEPLRLEVGRRDGVRGYLFRVKVLGVEEDVDGAPYARGGYVRVMESGEGREWLRTAAGARRRLGLRPGWLGGRFGPFYLLFLGAKIVLCCVGKDGDCLKDIVTGNARGFDVRGIAVQCKH
jgi:hypothetical protein